jgi:hypothetical protein
MPLAVQIQDENGQRIGDLWWHPRSTALLVHPDSDTTCVRFVDPYGDTTFNQLQLPILLEEIARLAKEAPDDAARGALLSLLEFLEGARDQVHTYVKFVGD